MTNPFESITDENWGPGQYRHIVTHAWWRASIVYRSSPFVYLAENIIRRWVPFEPYKEWVQNRATTGERIWLIGSQAEADALGLELTGQWPTGEFRGRHGNYGESIPESDMGNWQLPTPGFFAGLPRDPEELYERLRADSPSDRSGYIGPFQYARDVLITGVVPAEIRLPLYRALQLVPGVAVDSNVAKIGEISSPVAFIVNDGTTQHELLVRKTDGQIAGERTTLVRRDAETGLDAGTVLSLSEFAVTTTDTINL